MIKVASSNIRFDNPKDGKHDWAGRRAVLSTAINSFAPFILGSQEGRREQLKDFESLLCDLDLIDSHRDWISERMYPCLFYNQKIFNLVESGDIWLSETPFVPGSKSFGSAFPRLCTWATLELKQHAKKLICINVHLDHMKTETRQEQIKVLLKEIKSINIEGLPIILMGDFNEGPKEKVREIINGSGLTLSDPWLNLKKDEDISHHGFEGQKEAAKRIDWILSTREFSPISVDLYKESIEGIFPSDHYPVFAEFKV